LIKIFTSFFLDILKINSYPAIQVPSVVKCCKIIVICCKIKVIQIVYKILIILMEAKNGRAFHNSPELLPLLSVKNFSTFY